MMLLVNELLQDKDTKDTLRILWIDDGNVIAYLIDIHDDKSLPFKRSVAELIDEIIQEQLIKIKEEPFLFLRKAEESEKNIEMRDKAWAVVGNIVNEEPAIYEKNKRAEHIRNAMNEYNVSYPTVRKYLRKYWQRGKTPNALLPDYHKSGGKGKEKKASSSICEFTAIASVTSNVIYHYLDSREIHQPKFPSNYQKSLKGPEYTHDQGYI